MKTKTQEKGKSVGKGRDDEFSLDKEELKPYLARQWPLLTWFNVGGLFISLVLAPLVAIHVFYEGFLGGVIMISINSVLVSTVILDDIISKIRSRRKFVRMLQSKTERNELELEEVVEKMDPSQN